MEMFNSRFCDPRRHRGNLPVGRIQVDSVVGTSHDYKDVNDHTMLDMIYFLEVFVEIPGFPNILFQDAREYLFQNTFQTSKCIITNTSGTL